MILLVDNYDSFTYNLYQYLGELGADVKVVRNDALSVDEALALEPERIVISPGPGTPDEAGISLELVRRSPVPLLGVCLGHQALGQAFGGTVVRAAKLMHGKTSEIRHDGRTHLRGPARRVHGHALPLAGRRSRERAGLPRGLGLDRRRRRDGPAPPRAPARGRAVPPREHPDDGRQGPAAELPGPRPGQGRQGQHQAAISRSWRAASGSPRTRPHRRWARSWTATPRRRRSARCSRRWLRAARPRTRWSASRARCARARCRSRSQGAVDTCGTGGDGCRHLQHLDRRVVRGRRLRRAGGQARQPLGERHLRLGRRARGARRAHRRARPRPCRRRSTASAGPSCSRPRFHAATRHAVGAAQGDGRADRLQPARPAHEPGAARGAGGRRAEGRSWRRSWRAACSGWAPSGPGSCTAAGSTSSRSGRRRWPR